MVPYWWHATLLEIIWLVAGLVAVALTALNLHDAWKDTRVVDEIQDDPTIHERHYAMIATSAQARIRSQIIRLLIALLIVGAGVDGVIVANPLGGVTTWTGLGVTFALVGISALTALMALLDLVARNRLYELALGRTEVLAAKHRADAGL